MHANAFVSTPALDVLLLIGPKWNSLPLVVQVEYNELPCSNVISIRAAASAIAQAEHRTIAKSSTKWTDLSRSRE